MKSLKFLFFILNVVVLFGINGAEIGGPRPAYVSALQLCKKHLKSETAEVANFGTGDAACSKPILCSDKTTNQENVEVQPVDYLICDFYYFHIHPVVKACVDKKCVISHEFFYQPSANADSPK